LWRTVQDTSDCLRCATTTQLYHINWYIFSPKNVNTNLKVGYLKCRLHSWYQQCTLLISIIIVKKTKSCALSIVCPYTNDLITWDCLDIYYKRWYSLWPIGSFADKNLRLQMSSSCDVDDLIFWVVWCALGLHTNVWNLVSFWH